MGSLELGIGFVVIAGVALAAGVVVFLVARKALKLVVRLAIFGVIIVALLLGGIVFWFASLGKATKNAPVNRPANSRRQ